jgi:ABC-type xylose transport system permease subunit
VRDDDDDRETPNAVIAAVAAGTAVVPFLGVYAVMFIVHGGFHHVVPPDITSTAHGELIAGIIALALFVVAIIALFWMLNGSRRWPFVLVQLAVLGTAVDFVVDDTKGGRSISVVLAAAAVAALAFSFAPAVWDYVGLALPWRRRRPSAAAR